MMTRCPCELLNSNVPLLMQDEREERELRKVEMQTQKAENMIEHEAEIYARPPRTWFQTEKQKKESSKRGRPDADEEDVGARGKKAKKQKKEEGKGRKEKGSKEEKGRKQKDPLIEVRQQDHLPLYYLAGRKWFLGFFCVRCYRLLT